MQPKRRDTGHTGIKGCNLNLSDAIKSLNSQIDDAFSGQPEFKKTVLQGGNALINEQLPILIHCSYIKRFLGQFPLTGGHVMRDSFMCLSYIGRHRHQHPVLRQRYHLPGSVSKFKDHLVRINEAFDIFAGPFPFIGNGHGLNRINLFKVRVSRCFAVLKRLRLQCRNYC